MICSAQSSNWHVRTSSVVPLSWVSHKVYASTLSMILLWAGELKYSEMDFARSACVHCLHSRMCGMQPYFICKQAQMCSVHASTCAVFMHQHVLCPCINMCSAHALTRLCAASLVTSQAKRHYNESVTHSSDRLELWAGLWRPTHAIYSYTKQSIIKITYLSAVWRT